MLFRDDEYPKMKLVHSEPTTEKNTTIGRIPIKEVDYDLVISKIQSQLAYFGNIVYSSNIEDKLDYPKVYASEEGFHILNPTENIVPDSFKMLLGNVLYPLNYNETDTHFLRNGCVVLRFKIGELDLVPSREAVRYTPKTLEAINNRLLEVGEYTKKALKIDDDEVTNLFETYMRAEAFKNVNAANFNPRSEKDIYGRFYTFYQGLKEESNTTKQKFEHVVEYNYTQVVREFDKTVDPPVPVEREKISTDQIRINFGAHQGLDNLIKSGFTLVAVSEDSSGVNSFYSYQSNLNMTCSYNVYKRTFGSIGQSYAQSPNSGVSINVRDIAVAIENRVPIVLVDQANYTVDNRKLRSIYKHCCTRYKTFNVLGNEQEEQIMGFVLIRLPEVAEYLNKPLEVSKLHHDHAKRISAQLEFFKEAMAFRENVFYNIHDIPEAPLTEKELQALETPAERRARLGEVVYKTMYMSERAQYVTHDKYGHIPEYARVQTAFENLEKLSDKTEVYYATTKDKDLLETAMLIQGHKNALIVPKGLTFNEHLMYFNIRCSNAYGRVHSSDLNGYPFKEFDVINSWYAAEYDARRLDFDSKVAFLLVSNTLAKELAFSDSKFINVHDYFSKMDSTVVNFATALIINSSAKELSEVSFEGVNELQERRRHVLINFSRMHYNGNIVTSNPIFAKQLVRLCKTRGLLNYDILKVYSELKEYMTGIPYIATTSMMGSNASNKNEFRYFLGLLNKPIDCSEEVLPPKGLSRPYLLIAT
jgi:hypothetical protein